MNSRVLLYAFVFLPGLIFAGGQFIDKKILDVDEAFIFKSSIVENKIKYLSGVTINFDGANSNYVF